MSVLPRGLTVRRDAGLYGYERALRRAGLAPIAGVDEAGRGACAGPLVAAAAILPEGQRGTIDLSVLANDLAGATLHCECQGRRAIDGRGVGVCARVQEQASQHASPLGRSTSTTGGSAACWGAFC